MSKHDCPTCTCGSAYRTVPKKAVLDPDDTGAWKVPEALVQFGRGLVALSAFGLAMLVLAAGLYEWGKVIAWMFP